MKWQIPAKTFLVGEYAALTQGPAIIVTTSPYFELCVTDTPGLSTINPQSPAGLLWQQENVPQQGLVWNDPYQGIGGLGASSAQFIGCYLATCSLNDHTPSLSGLLDAYYRHAWSGSGLKPSGYDVIAQTQSGCVYIHKAKEIVETFAWPFADLSFVLVHTGSKLATHQHLQNLVLPHNIARLSEIAEQTYRAILEKDAALFIQLLNLFNHELIENNCVAAHSLELINKMKEYPEVLAIKGCGAMGADVIMLVVALKDKEKMLQKMKQNNCLILTTEQNCTKNTNLFKIA